MRQERHVDFGVEQKQTVGNFGVLESDISIEGSGVCSCSLVDSCHDDGLVSARTRVAY